MSEPLDLDELRRTHVERDPELIGPRCSYCDEDFPCLTRQLLDLLETAEARATAAEVFERELQEQRDELAANMGPVTYYVPTLIEGIEYWKSRALRSERDVHLAWCNSLNLEAPDATCDCGFSYERDEPPEIPGVYAQLENQSAKLAQARAALDYIETHLSDAGWCRTCRDAARAALEEIAQPPA